MKYSDFIFDLYGTLVDIHTEESLEVWEKTALYFGFHGVACSANELKAAFTAELDRRKAQAGQSYECFPDIPFDSVMSTLFCQMGIEDSSGELGKNAATLFRIASIEYIRLYPFVIEALERLRSKGFRLWLLSNAQRVFTEQELKYLGLWDKFDGIYISSDYGCRKPDIRFFNALLDEKRLDKSRCLMIGNDRETDIAGAKNTGIDTLYLHTNLTPPNQAAADPLLMPGTAPCSSSAFEYEGCNWSELAELISEI